MERGSLAARNSEISDMGAPSEWREKEREDSRVRIEKALEKNTQSYEELLLYVTAIDEELLHISSMSKMQYFDNAMDYERNLQRLQSG